MWNVRSQPKVFVRMQLFLPSDEHMVMKIVATMVRSLEQWAMISHNSIQTAFNIVDSTVHEQAAQSEMRSEL